MWTEWHLVGGNDSTHYEAVWVPGNKRQTGCTANRAAAEAWGEQKMCVCRSGPGLAAQYRGCDKCVKAKSGGGHQLSRDKSFAQ